MRRRGANRWAWVAAAAGLVASAAPAGAFYFLTPPEKTVINPPDKGKPGNPPDRPPVKPPPVDVPPETPPEALPEPATLFGALAGLGALAAARVWRQRKPNA